MNSENEFPLEIRGLTHFFKKHQALNNVSFNVQERSIHGFVGPNGAGKTTTLKVIATLLCPTSGNATVYGNSVTGSPQTVRTRIGYMPDHFSMYRQMTVFEYLDFFAAAYGLDWAKRNSVIKDVLDLTDMAGRRDSLVESLSRGMQQRVSLARVLVHDPDLLLLDEPASGLDPRARIELMEILKELRNMGKTIFISSHILSELADLCDCVTIIDAGTIKYSGEMAHLLEGGGGPESCYIIRLREALPEDDSFLAGVEGVIATNYENDNKTLRVTCRNGDALPNEILQAVMSSGVQIISFDREKKHLNQAFMDLTTPGVRK